MRFDPIAFQKETRRLHRAGELTHAQFAVADVLTWSCRPKGKDSFQVGYDRIAELACVAHSTAVEAVARLRDLGLLTWEKTRLRVVWSLGVASRQWRNIYTLRAPVTESAQRPTDSHPELFASVMRAAEGELDRLTGMGTGLMRTLASLGKAIARKQGLIE